MEAPGQVGAQDGGAATGRSLGPPGTNASARSEEAESRVNGTSGRVAGELALE